MTFCDNLWVMLPLRIGYNKNYMTKSYLKLSLLTLAKALHTCNFINNILHHGSSLHHRSWSSSPSSNFASPQKLSTENNFEIFSESLENLWAVCFHCDIHSVLIHCILKVENSTQINSRCQRQLDGRMKPMVYFLLLLKLLL